MLFLRDHPMHAVAVVLSLVSCVRAFAAELPWPYNLPPHAKYYPEDEMLVKRDLEISQRIQSQIPSVIRKMSGDPGEKFFLDYWSFSQDESTMMLSDNSTNYDALSCPLPLHSDEHIGGFPRRAFPLAYLETRRLQRRDFGCPADTSACSSIGRSNLCCPNGSTCQIVPDSGLGDVGCCDASQSCAGSLSQCPAGYTSCPNYPGGGCCMPGYACYQEGCVVTSTTVVLVTPTTTTTSTTTTSMTTTTTTLQPTTTALTTSPSVDTTSPTPTTTTTAAPNILTCSSGYRSCPASQGGGCCSTDRACGRDYCPELSTTASLTAPVRLTTASKNSQITSTDSLVDVCPTGFYACSAYHQGGCCQVGRDCASTSCPTVVSATVVNTNGITLVAPSGSYLTNMPSAPTGACASGWSSCATDIGGGCCPTGYSCGTASCSATASGAPVDSVGKEAPQPGLALRMANGRATMIWGVVIAYVGSRWTT